jgi:hypothetical protein
MRNEWEYRDTLMPSPHTAAIAHSYGGTLAEESTTQIPNMAFVSLSGQLAVPLGPQPVLSPLHGPSLFLWNNSVGDMTNNEVMDPPAGQLWSLVGAPKHGVRFTGGAHGDYLTGGTSPCTSATPHCCQQGSCNLVGPLSVDLATTFLPSTFRLEG